MHRNESMEDEGNRSMDLLPEHTRKFLKETPRLLNSFHYEDVHAFLKLGTEHRYANGDIIVDENEFHGVAYLIAKGSVTIWNDGIELTRLEEGAFLGESFLFQKTRTSAKLQAENDVTLLRFERYDVLNFFRKKPGKLFNIFTKNIIEIQQEKIQNMNSQVVSLKKRLLGNDYWT